MIVVDKLIMRALDDWNGLASGVSADPGVDDLLGDQGSNICDSIYSSNTQKFEIIFWAMEEHEEGQGIVDVGSKVSVKDNLALGFDWSIGL